MIQEFSVQNFLSIGDEQTISFVASKDKHLLDELTVEVKPKLRLLRMAIVFGANASGKTNLLLAMNALWKLMFRPEQNKQERIAYYRPFALRKNETTRMKCIFWAMGKCYHYELEYNQREILLERLQYTSDKNVLSLAYERRKDEDIKFGSTLEVRAQERNDLMVETLPNHTLISTFAKKNIKIPLLEGLHQWIGRHICELGEHNNAVQIAEESESMPELKALVLELMSEADFNIVDFQLIETSPSKEFIEKVVQVDDLPSSFKEELIKPSKELLIKHQTPKNDYFISFKMESSGTQTYFRLARLLFNLKTDDYVFMEDELDEALHYELLVHYLKTYLQMPNKSQLIFTSHNLMLLDEDWMMRRDMVYLTERNRESGSTQVSRVSDMGLHKNISMLNAYRIGKLGSKPHLGSTYLPI